MTDAEIVEIVAKGGNVQTELGRRQARKEFLAGASGPMPQMLRLMAEFPGWNDGYMAVWKMLREA